MLWRVKTKQYDFIQLEALRKEARPSSENSIGISEAKKRGRSFHVEETILAETLAKYLKNLGTDIIPKEKKKRVQDRAGEGDERVSSADAIPWRRHGLYPDNSGITHLHCETVTLAVICDEQFWEGQEWIWADLWANYSALPLLSKRSYRQYIKE